MNDIETPEAGDTGYRVGAPTLRKDTWILALLVLDAIFGVVAWGLMPDRVPVHWSFSGEPNGWGPKGVNAFLLPLLAAGLYLLILMVPYLDPKRRNYALFEDTLRFVRGILVVFLVGVHVVVVLASLGRQVPMDMLLRAGLPLLMAALGNQFGKLRPNWFVGIRVPWTLSNDEVWVKTHRLAGTLWVVGGVLGFVLAFLLPPSPGVPVLFGILAVMAIVPIVYSYWLWRRLAQD